MSQANTGIQLSPPPYSSPFVNPQTGVMSVAWQQWFQVLFNRIGGLSAPPLNALPTESPLIVNQYIPTSQTTMYTSPGALSTIIDIFSVQNKSNSAVTVSAWIIPPNASMAPTPATLVINNISMAARSTQSFSAQIGTILPGGGIIVFQASAANAVQPIIYGRLASS